jgi:UDP-GlcNAc:undecaprenyl-phosphate/decaprenyl-phosphate GlcNAc-1-phosphate transferase
MDKILLPFLTGFLTTALICFPTIKLARRFGLIDDPSLRPHPAHAHLQAIPRAGGLACFIGIFISILIFMPIEKHIIGIILGMLVLLIVGLIDDKKIHFSPISRLFFQFLAAILVVSSGIGITYITSPFGGIIRFDSLVIPIDFIGTHYIVVIADILALVWIVWMMNMTNWANGVDGQTPGFITIASAILGFYSLNLYLSGDPNQLSIAILAFITSGAALGFLPFNWFPAKIFLGFSGTTIFGLLIAVLAILSGAKLAIALLVLLIPAVDSIYTGTRRILSGKSPFLGDQNHLHHLLLKRGWSHQKISLFYVISCAILGLLAINLPSQGKLFSLIVVGVIIVAIITWLNFFGALSKPPDQDNG